ncbi:chemotaxis protein [Ectobacillus sp. JY-23]|uniref:chemotaxis protein n=1 Tax=Ectobacillus sp. JY-23 TaxID=2933872 RepID=UPI001FF6807A|nr:chemotaxis protein [Ectobacillus sp. JY-23]UOY93035.1 chemotaxis protein [Ectobacillus sp. JY-23]
MQKVAATIIHGMGTQKQEYAEDMVMKLQNSFAKKIEQWTDSAETQLIVRPVYWADIFTPKEEELYEKLVVRHKLRYKTLRRFLMQYLADAIAYQPVSDGSHNYERIHMRIGDTLHALSELAGERAPLCVISHSLGSAVASNYFYDLQKNCTNSVVCPSSPLERGDTLALFYTMGTTLSLWSLRYYNFDRPVNIPAAALADLYPKVHGEWINFYDKDDMMSYPLRDVNESYKRAVTADKPVNVGNLLTSWNPLSHAGYFRDPDIIDTVTDGLARVWRQVNRI